jgi:hypothetical protein
MILVLSVMREQVRGLEGGTHGSAHTRVRRTAQPGAGGGRRRLRRSGSFRCGQLGNA